MLCILAPVAACSTDPGELVDVSGTVTGLVRSSQGEPVPGAEVTVVAIAPEALRLRVVDSTAGLADAGGRYTIVVRAMLPAPGPVLLRVHARPPATSPLAARDSLGATLRLGGAPDTAGIDFFLPYLPD